MLVSFFANELNLVTSPFHNPTSPLLAGNYQFTFSCGTTGKTKISLTDMVVKADQGVTMITPTRSLVKKEKKRAPLVSGTTLIPLYLSCHYKLERTSHKM